LDEDPHIDGDREFSQLEAGVVDGLKGVETGDVLGRNMGLIVVGKI